MALLILDSNDYLIGYSSSDTDTLEDSNNKTIITDIDISEEELFKNFNAYKYENNTLILDLEKKNKIEEDNFLNEIRSQRSTECFPIINRGALWYNTLTEDQLKELNTWYLAWLDAPETKNIPEKPIFIK